MDELLKTIITNAPNLLGLVVLAYVLYRQNERLMSNILDDTEELKQVVQHLTARIDQVERNMPRATYVKRADPSLPPYNPNEPSNSDIPPWDN